MKAASISIFVTFGFAIFLAVPTVFGQGNSKARADFFKNADKNEDGALSKSEVPARVWEKLGKLDKNGDDKVTKEELGAAMADRAKGGGDKPDPEKFFAMADKNKDGKITKSEAPAMWERLSRADRDGDGAVTMKELQPAAQMGRQRPGQGPKGANGVMVSFDENQDGKLVKDEVSAEMWAKISRLDENSDGAISLAELGQAWKS